MDPANLGGDGRPGSSGSLSSGELKPAMARPAVEAMIAADPTEAARSSDILAALRQRFTIVEERSIGGALLRLGLGDTAQNVRPEDPDDRAHLERFFALEDRATQDGTIGSDFVVVTAARD